jgi:hypothetical protein
MMTPFHRKPPRLSIHTVAMKLTSDTNDCGWWFSKFNRWERNAGFGLYYSVQLFHRACDRFYYQYCFLLKVIIMIYVLWCYISYYQ